MSDFKATAERVAQALETEAVGTEAETSEATGDEHDLDEGEGEGEGEAEAEAEAPALAPAPVAPVVAPVTNATLANPNAAMFFLKADKTAENATWTEAFVDHTVQFGQPYPAITHCEMWIGESASTPRDDNHFSTYLGASEGARWTSGLSGSRRFYGCGDEVTEEIASGMARSSWSAIPIFAANGAEHLRRQCNRHAGTPYPSPLLLWQYPMSTWPLRAFSGLLSDRAKTPAHCATLSARILRAALPQTAALAHPSHWYGPSSLYLELATPARMEQALRFARPVERAQVQEEEDDQLANVLAQHSDEEVAAMRRGDAHKALEQLAIHVLRAGSRTSATSEVDQDDFRDAQERYAWGLCRYTWKHRKGATP